MATISDERIIITMLMNNGCFPGDPPAKSIYMFTQDDTGEILHAVFYEGERCDIHESPFVANPVLLWGDGEVTPDGHKFIKLIEECKRLKKFFGGTL